MSDNNNLSAEKPRNKRKKPKVYESTRPI